MADGKWIAGLDANLPVADAARLALVTRLDAVCTHLQPARESAYSDCEHVHQLRVATRRAGAALAAFRGCLPKAEARATKKLLRGLRRAAGAARDWDVFLQMLRAARPLQAEAARAARDLLIGFALGQRAAAQTTLAAVIGESADDLRALCERLPERVNDHADREVRTLGDLAVMLEAAFASFTTAVRHESRAAADLHAVRIRGKNLRYSIELFAACFAPALREELYPAIEAVQELLGQAQDASVALERLRALREMAESITPDDWVRVRPGFGKLTTGLQAAQRANRKKYDAWSRQWRMLLDRHPLVRLTGEA